MKILDRSIEVARALYPSKFDERRCYHWTIVFKGSKLLAIGENKYKTSPRNLRNQTPNGWEIQNKKICSELAAFTKIRTTYQNLNYRKVDVVNIRIDREGKIRNSMPCNFCQSLLGEYLGLRDLWHTNNDGEFELYKF